MRCVVLAAGNGSRLGDLTKARTKGMVPVLGKKLIDYLLEFLDVDFFDEIIIVGGFCYGDLLDHINAKNIKNVRVVENKDYLKGNIYSMLSGISHFENDSFLLTNVDHIYPPAMFETMKNSFSGITAMCDFDRELFPDDMKVKLAEDGRHIAEISKQLESFDCGYIGMTYVDISMEKKYREAADATIQRFGQKAVVENILQLLADSKDKAPAICDLSGFGWFEVDDAEDLFKAEKYLPDHPRFVSTVKL